MGGQPEKVIERAILDWLSIRPEAFAWKNENQGTFDPRKKVYRKSNNPYKIKGVADILGFWLGTFIAIEVKCPGKYPTKEQKEFLDNVNRHGGVGFVARGIDDVKRELTEKNLYQRLTENKERKEPGKETTADRVFF